MLPEYHPNLKVNYLQNYYPQWFFSVYVPKRLIWFQKVQEKLEIKRIWSKQIL